jgi:hypothetical protein
VHNPSALCASHCISVCLFWVHFLLLILLRFLMVSWAVCYILTFSPFCRDYCGSTPCRTLTDVIEPQIIGRCFSLRFLTDVYMSPTAFFAFHGSLSSFLSRLSSQCFFDIHLGLSLMEAGSLNSVSILWTHVLICLISRCGTSFPPPHLIYPTQLYHSLLHTDPHIWLALLHRQFFLHSGIFFRLE